MLALPPQQASVPGPGLQEVDKLLKQLQANLEDVKLSLKQQETILAQVKVLGRDPSNAAPIFAEKGISTLSQYAFDSSRSVASREALRCLANALLLNEPSRQEFVDLGYAYKAAERLKNDDRDDEFLVSRILFLLTYNTKVNLEELIANYQLADSINQHVAGHAKRMSKSTRRRSNTSPMEEMALVETLKLMFNITYYYPGLADRFTKSIEPLIKILLGSKLPSPPLQSPVTYLLNALLNLDLKSAEKSTPLGRNDKSSPLFPYAEPEHVIDRLISILDQAIQKQPEKELDQAAAPLVTLLRRIYELAPATIRSFMRWILLPTEESRSKPLGQGETFSARLLRLSSSPMLPTLRENISSLLFELSDKDATKFVKNIGYGFASGFLMSHNIDIPQNAMEASSTRSDSSAGAGAEVNPITGQRLDAEEHTKAPEMTQDEKEREAERLFVLFERLRATGVVDVKNPVQQAMEEGRFEELDD